MAIDDLEAALREKAQASTGLNAKIAFDLGEAGALHLDATRTPPAVSQEGGSPDTTITISADDLAELLAGRLNPMAAFGAGRLKVSGDMGPAMKLGALFG